MNTDNFKALIDRYISGTPAEGDRETLRRLLDDPQYREQLSAMMDVQLASKEAAAYQYPEAVARIKAAIEEKISKETPVRHISLIQRSWFKVAAVAIVLLGATALLRLSTHKKITVSHPVMMPSASVLPGHNKAVLTLADGATIALDSAGNKVIQQGNAKITQHGGQLQYAVLEHQPGAVGYNILATPNGGQYQLTLPDGTKVWLNSSSSLHFPTDFNTKERTVKLSGEAYFEVAKNEKMPFKVVIKDVEIDVLGTDFNVMAYADENHITTTLLTGAVKVHNHVKGVLLKPGQQALLNNSNEDIRVSPGDTEGAVAWKNGYFNFSNENIQSVMRKISRWYNVEVEYQGDVTHKVLWGTISRFENISEVLRMLELTGSIHFSMQGRKITVKP